MAGDEGGEGHVDGGMVPGPGEFMGSFLKEAGKRRHTAHPSGELASVSDQRPTAIPFSSHYCCWGGGGGGGLGLRGRPGARGGLVHMVGSVSDRRGQKGTALHPPKIKNVPSLRTSEWEFVWTEGVG